MSKNKTVPRELQKYVVVIGNKTNFNAQFFKTQKEAKAWASKMNGKKKLFKIAYDFYEEL